MQIAKGIIFDIREFSIHDGPGIRTTVFFKGCPLRCRWCHNPEGLTAAPELVFWASRCIGCGACVEACAHGALTPDGMDVTKCVLCGACVAACCADARQIVGREMTAAQVMAEIERDVPFYDESGGGATFSGGEPLSQPDFLLELLRACRARGVHTAVDTCGFAPWEVVERVQEHVDLFLYDLKLMDDARHREFTGVSNESILSNLRALAQRGREIVVRLPLIPGVNDDEENLRRTAAFLAALPRPPRVDILPYHRLGNEKYSRLKKPHHFFETRLPSAEQVAAAALIFDF